MKIHSERKMDEKELAYFENVGILYQNVIAQGGFGTIFLVFSVQYQQYFALKKIPEQRFNESEIECLMNLDHPNTIMLYKCFRFDGYVYMLMEYCPKDLATILSNDEPLEEDLIRKYCYDILIAIKACHDKNIAHGDIKPSNFLIDKYGRIKVCDFGLSTIHQDIPMSSSYKGTFYFMCPELIQKKIYNPLKSDIWAIGVTFYFIATRRYPFYSSNPQVLMNVIEAGVYPAFKVKNILLRNVISRCLEVNPEKRATIQELLKMKYFDPITTRKLVKNRRCSATMSHELFVQPICRSLNSKLERNSLVPFRSSIVRPSILKKL